jgi:hypothetical protein
MRRLLAAALLTGCSGLGGNVDWQAVEGAVSEDPHSGFVEYFAEDNTLAIEVEPGTAEADAERLACDVAAAAIRGAGGTAENVVVSVFERGSDHVLFDGADCQA